ncbi:hypothetical protein ISCGN_007308 [Ixodes scapularis]
MSLFLYRNHDMKDLFQCCTDALLCSQLLLLCGQQVPGRACLPRPCSYRARRQGTWWLVHCRHEAHFHSERLEKRRYRLLSAYLPQRRKRRLPKVVLRHPLSPASSGHLQPPPGRVMADACTFLQGAAWLLPAGYTVGKCSEMRLWRIGTQGPRGTTARGALWDVRDATQDAGVQFSVTLDFQPRIVPGGRSQLGRNHSPSPVHHSVEGPVSWWPGTLLKDPVAPEAAAKPKSTQSTDLFQCCTDALLCSQLLLLCGQQVPGRACLPRPCSYRARRQGTWWLVHCRHEAHFHVIQDV